jgi:hypothetical protein
MPISLTDLTSTLSGSGLLTPATSISSTNGTGNYAEVDGCSSYFDIGQSASVILNKFLNIGWVKNSLSFTYELYAIQSSTYYKIAHATTGLLVT